jgi:hypothetical protein
MVSYSKVNANFPVPGIDQSSQGFRDNFSIIKTELEAIQGKHIILSGDVTSTPVIIDSGSDDIIINCTVATQNVAAGGSNLSVQYNINGILSGNSGFTYDPVTSSVGIGTTTPQVSLDVWGNSRFKNYVLVGSTAANLANITVQSSVASAGTAILSSVPNAIVLNSATSAPMLLQIGGSNIANISSSGLVVSSSISTVATTMLDIISSGEDVARFKATSNNQDSGVRITTDQANSSAGIMLEQRNVDSVVGMRISQNGFLSLHSGEHMDAQLSTSTSRMVIDNVGRVGIGTQTPVSSLHVIGSITSTNHTDLDPPAIPVTSINVNLVLDQWLSAVYRSANYTIQITNPATGDISLSKVLVMHSNGNANYAITSNINNAGVLGTISALSNGAYIQLLINTAISGLTVKLDSRYITI